MLPRAASHAAGLLPGGRLSARGSLLPESRAGWEALLPGSAVGFFYILKACSLDLRITGM